MTPGTSPHSPGTPSARRTAIGDRIESALLWAPDACKALVRRSSDLARAASILYLAGLGIAVATGWQAHSAAGEGAISSFPAWHLAFLMTMGAAAALLTIGKGGSADKLESSSPPSEAARAGMSELMAQMSHELRTPLNAVIGFSDVMLRELHGPLGNARYQEYAHHISESGERLLKSSEEALAVTEAMTALMAERRPGRRERLVASTLLRDAWQAAGQGSGGTKHRLSLTTCTTCELLCERRPTVQALEHLCREALARMPDGGPHGGPNGGTVEAIGRREGGRRSLEIRVQGGGRDGIPHAGLRVILARLLLEVQGASLTCATDAGGAWTAVVAFPGRR